MAIVVPDEISVEDVPMVDMGTATTRNLKRRVRIYIRDLAVTANDTVDLSLYVSGLAGIDGVEYDTDDSAVGATAPTWSGTTLTFKNSGSAEICVMGTLT